MPPSEGVEGFRGRTCFATTYTNFVKGVMLLQLNRDGRLTCRPLRRYSI
jgi:hypothetical protein